MDKIIPAFETSLFNPTLSDACIDITELGIDSILDECVYKNIPIVSILIGVGKTAQNIHDRNLLRQTIKFINTFNEKKISSKQLERYRTHLNDNPQFTEEELGRVIILLNSNIDLKKSELLAKFYRSYVNEEIDWDQFIELSDVISKIFIADIQLLYNIFNHQVLDTTQCKEYQVDRLVALGLLKTSGKFFSEENSSGGSTLNITDDRNLNCSTLGYTFCQLAQ